MKEFDPNKPYRRRDGKPAKIVYKYLDGKYLVVYKPYEQGTYEREYRVLSTGIVTVGYNDLDDLINIPEQIGGWVTVYKNTVGYYVVEDYLSEDKSDINAMGLNVVARKFISFTEGEGL